MLGNKEKQLQGILDRLHHKFTYRADNEEYWARYDPLAKELVDDCDGFAIAARDECRLAGYRARLVSCESRATREGHLVCFCEGYVLDNTSPMIRTWEVFKWYFVPKRISGYEDGEIWHLVVN